MKDMYNQITVLPLFNPVASAGDNSPWVSAIIDRQEYESLTLCPQFGNIPDADMTSALLVEHGDAANLSDAAAVSDEMLIGTEASIAPIFSSDNTVKKIGYIGDKRYVRMTITPAANTGATLYGGVAILGHPHATPVP